jgi:hypothetical protein
MDKALEFIIEVFKQNFNLSEKDIEKIKEEVSYLEYAITDAIINYPNKKLDILSIIIYFSYVLGNILETDELMMLFLTTLMGIYDGKKLAKYKS